MNYNANKKNNNRFIQIKSEEGNEYLINADSINYVISANGKASLFLDSDIIPTANTMQEISELLLKIEW